MEYVICAASPGLAVQESCNVLEVTDENVSAVGAVVRVVNANSALLFEVPAEFVAEAT